MRYYAASVQGCQGNTYKDQEKDLGIAFDIGTTTIAGSLLSLKEREELNTLSLLNPQIELGRDVLSRVKAVDEDKDKLYYLHERLIEAINKMIDSLFHSLAPTLYSPHDVMRAVFVGNPVMEHLLLCLSPVSIGKAPYKPLFKEGKTFSASALALNINPSASVYCFPLIGGFVGGDTVSFILYTSLYRERGLTLAIDIGTNTEICLKTHDGIWVTSAPAGPAFEGGGIGSGMIAEKGAISGVSIDDEFVRLEVIGGGTPEGICGSGLIDAVSEMLMRGIIDINGRLRCRDEIANNIANRIQEKEQGNTFMLYKDVKREIAITQNDIRELQLAKASIQAGIKTLLKRKNVKPEAVERVFITGAFGNNISVISLKGIGVIPEVWEDRVSFIEDAPLQGAKKALLCEEAIKEAEGIARKAYYTPLSGNPLFEREFIKAMNFNNQHFWEA